MKKFYSSLVALCLILAGGMMMVSCDEDIEDAMDLSGDWEGDMGMYMDLDGDPNTQYDIFDAHNTWIAFYPKDDYATWGYGEEVDYFTSDCPYRYQNLYFEWHIRNQVLYLEYPYNHKLDVAIYDYRFRNKRTVLEFTINNEYFCHLNKLRDGYENSWYWWDHDDAIMKNNHEYYHYMTWAEWNLAKGREGGVAASENNAVKPENVKLGRDFSKFEHVNAVK